MGGGGGELDKISLSLFGVGNSLYILKSCPEAELLLFPLCEGCPPPPATGMGWRVVGEGEGAEGG